ncbi:MAG: protein kinase [Thermoanaerobaculia bacterium]
MDMSPEETREDPRIGRLLDGRYRLVRRIGVGGKGIVYEARHEEMGRSVAIKVLSQGIASDPVTLDRFRREGRAAGRLNHPNVVLVHDFCISSTSEAYLVMELCPDGSLADELSRDGRATLERTASVIGAVASAVDAAHRVGIVHRDLKPANILVAGNAVKVADFGLATLAADDDPAPGLTGEHAVGSPHYMSPEQAQGNPSDVRSDVYSLGVVAYEMLTGFVPFSGSTLMQVLMKHVTQPPRPPIAMEPSLPVAASDAILRALEKDPVKRFGSVTAFADVLVAALDVSPRPRSSSSKAETNPVKAVMTVTMDTAFEALPEGEAPSRPIGREAPLAVMNTRLLESLRGRGGFLLISGEPGAGKTTLVEEFLSRELEVRPEILRATGRCSETFGAGEAYLPFLEIASRLTAGLEEGRVAGFLRTLAPTWCRHLPALLRLSTMDERGELPAVPAQERMPREFTDFLAVLCTLRPVILVLEDLHWADSSSVDLLAYLARRIGEMRLLVIATYRPSEIEVARHPLRQALRGLSSSSGSMTAEIAPSPFSVGDVEAFLSRELRAEVDPEVVSFVHKRTEGNPLFVVNVLRHLVSLGAIRVENGRACATRPLQELSDEVPVGINGVILSRLDRLDEDDRKLLQAASVQGEVFDSGAVSAMLTGDELEIEDRLDRLHHVHGLVEPVAEIEFPDGSVSAGYRFVHAFYQDALYDSVLARRKTAWHETVGLLLMERHARNPDAVAPILAVHFERARNIPRALTALERAVEISARRNPREAEPLLLRALALAGRLPEEMRSGERARLLTRLGLHDSEAAEIVGDVGLYDRAEAAVTEALALDPRGPHAPEARTTLGLVRLERGQNENALSDFKSVVSEWPAHAPAHAGLAYLYKNTGLWERALASQDAAGEIDAHRKHSIPRLSVLVYQGRYAEAHAESDALLRDRPRYSHFTYWKGIVHFYAGDLPAARQWIERGFELDPDNFIAKGLLAFILAQDEDDRVRASALLNAAEPGARADGTFTYWIAKVRAALGDLDGAVAWIARAEALGYWNAPWLLRDRALDPLRGLDAFSQRVASMTRRQEAFGKLVREGER